MILPHRIPIVGLSALLSLLSLTVRPALCDDRVHDFLKFLPADVNSLSIVRVDQIMQTPRAIKDDWRGKHEAEFLAGSARLPPWVSLLVRGAQLRSGGAGPAMVTSIVPEPEAISFDKLFSKEKVTFDTVAGVRALRSKRGYLAEIAPGVLGFMAPPDRHSLGAWIRTIGGDSHIRLPKYLAGVAETYKPQILFAVDLEDLLEPAAMADRVASSAALVGKTAEQAAVKGLLAKLKGIRVGVDVDRQIHAAIALDFDGATVPEASYLKPLLSELLDDAGAHLDDLDTATVKIQSTSVEIAGPISDETLRRLMTFIITPVALQKEEYLPTESSKLPPPPQADATQKYFSLVNSTVHNLQILNHRAKDYYKTAQWHENYANKIAGFPTLDVDPDVVKYAQYIVSGLRALAASLRGAGLELTKLDNQVAYQWHVNDFYGPAGTFTAYGYNPAPWEVSSNLQQIRNAQDDAAEKNSDDREKVWTSMGNERDSIRGRMEAKYNTKFSL